MTLSPSYFGWPTTKLGCSNILTRSLNKVILGPQSIIPRKSRSYIPTNSQQFHLSQFYRSSSHTHTLIDHRATPPSHNSVRSCIYLFFSIAYMCFHSSIFSLYIWTLHLSNICFVLCLFMCDEYIIQNCSVPCLLLYINI